MERRSLKKKSGLQRDSNPWPQRYRCEALPNKLWSYTLGARSIYWVHIFPCGEMTWSLYEIIHSCAAGCRWKWRVIIADFFRLLLSNCLNWKIYCDDHSSLSSTTAVQIWIISYKLHITDIIRYQLNCHILSIKWIWFICLSINITTITAVIIVY